MYIVARRKAPDINVCSMIDVNTWVMIDNGGVWQMSTSCTADPLWYLLMLCWFKGNNTFKVTILQQKYPVLLVQQRPFINGPYCCFLKSTDLRASADTKLICGLVEVEKVLAISRGALLTGRTLSNCRHGSELYQGHGQCPSVLCALEFSCSVPVLKHRPGQVTFTLLMWT